MNTSGTAAHHNDLLHRLVDWLVNTVGWTELDYSGVPSPDGATLLADVALRAPGATAGNEYFLFINTSFNVGAGSYGWTFRAAVDYDADLIPANQENPSPEVFFNLWENPIDYWFYANGRRVIVVAKCNTSYISMYAGLFLPFALPSEYPRPFLVGGNYNSLQPYDLSNSRNRFIADPGSFTMFYLNRDANEWKAVSNHDSSGANVSPTVLGNAIMWPHRGLRQTASADATSDTESWNQQGLSQMRPLDNGEIPMFKCHILSYGELKAVGALDGVYSVPGFGKTSEQVLSFSPRQFRVFQNIFRTTSRDFMSIEEN